MLTEYFLSLIAAIIIIIIIVYIFHPRKETFKFIPPLKFTPPHEDTCRAECLARFGVDGCKCFFDPEGYIETVLPPPIVKYG